VASSGAEAPGIIEVRPSSASSGERVARTASFTASGSGPPEKIDVVCSG